MIGSRAAELARLKVTYAAWTIRRTDDDAGVRYEARRNGTAIHTRSLADLETQLRSRETRGPDRR